MSLHHGVERSLSLDDLRQDLLDLVCKYDLERTEEECYCCLDTILKPAPMWTAEETFDLLVHSHTPTSAQIQVLKHSVRFMPISSPFWRQEDHLQKRVIHILAEWWHCFLRDLRDERETWITKLVEIAYLGGNLHAPCGKIHTHRGTPMQILLHRSHRYYGIWYHGADAHSQILRTWVKVVATAGVDLLTYGQTEQSLWRSALVENSNAPRIYGFHSGMKTNDWEVFVEQAGDRYAGIFWNLIERPEQTIPGSWIDEPEELWEDQHFRYLRERRGHNMRSQWYRRGIGVADRWMHLLSY